MRYNEIFVENRRFEPTPPVFGASDGGDPVWVFFVIPFWYNAGLWQADRQTNGQTEFQVSSLMMINFAAKVAE